MADWASTVALYAVVYPDEVPGPFNRDINVKSPPSFSLRSTPIRERYDRFYIQASTHPQTRGVPRVVAGVKNARCTLLVVKKRRKIEIIAKKRLAQVAIVFTGFLIYRLCNRIYRKILRATYHTLKLFFIGTKTNTKQIL